MEATLESEIQSELMTLPPTKQREVLAFARSLKEKKAIGMPGASYFPIVEDFSPEDLAEMDAAIWEGCERIDVDGW
ncbi:MAG: hypothetical protein WCT04_05360 [Planctomycetota bacterium]